MFTAVLCSFASAILRCGSYYSGPDALPYDSAWSSRRMRGSGQSELRVSTAASDHAIPDVTSSFRRAEGFCFTVSTIVSYLRHAQRWGR